MDDHLNPKERMFVVEYLVDKNATQAALRAGYAKSTAEKKAPLWVGKSRDRSPKPHVWDAVEKGLEELAQRALVTADEVVLELKAVGFANMGDFLTIGEDGSVHLDFSALKEADLRALNSFIQKHIPTKGGHDIVETKFTLGNKVQALTKLGEHLGIFKAPGQRMVGEFVIDLSGGDND